MAVSGTRAAGHPPGVTESSPPPGPPGDDDLIERAATTDPASMAILFDRHGAACYALAHRMLGESEAAETAVREAFLGLWRSGSSFDRGSGPVRSQLLDLVHDECVGMLRARPGGAAPMAPGLPIQGLAPELWAVLELAYFGALTEQQIAERLGLPVATVKERARRGLEQLRDRLPDGGGSAV